MTHRTLHTLCGLPRSGTTLLANVLSQHPDVHVSGTSALPLCVESIVNTLSNAPEVQSDLANVPGAYDRYLSAIRGLINEWYADRPESHVIDKGRGWIMHRALIDQLGSAGTMIVCIRDPRDVIASIERQHRATAAFNSPVARTLYDTCDLLMRPDGMVGGPMRMIEDVIRRQLTGITFVRYEALAVDPCVVIERVQSALGLAPHRYDFDGVENTATDLDALYRMKYPHDASGKIKPSGHHFSEVIDPELARMIAGVYPLYMQTFGYV